MKDLHRFLLGSMDRETCADVAKRAMRKVISGPFKVLASVRKKLKVPLSAPPFSSSASRSERMSALKSSTRLGDSSPAAARDFGRLLRCTTIRMPQANGQGYSTLLSPASMIAKIQEEAPGLFNSLLPPFLSLVHGDLHFKNVLLDDRLPLLMDIKLIDPRGKAWPGSRAGTGDPAYDIGKLLHFQRRPLLLHPRQTLRTARREVGHPIEGRRPDGGRPPLSSRPRPAGRPWPAANLDPR